VKGNLDDEEEHKRIQRQGNYGTGSTMHYFLSTQPPEAGRLQALLHSDSHWYCTPGKPMDSASLSRDNMG